MGVDRVGQTRARMASTVDEHPWLGVADMGRPSSWVPYTRQEGPLCRGDHSHAQIPRGHAS
jgi:hypothetical protein